MGLRHPSWARNTPPQAHGHRALSGRPAGIMVSCPLRAMAEHAPGNQRSDQAGNEAATNQWADRYSGPVHAACWGPVGGATQAGRRSGCALPRRCSRFLTIPSQNGTAGWARARCSVAAASSSRRSLDRQPARQLGGSFSAAGRVARAFTNASKSLAATRNFGPNLTARSSLSCIQLRTVASLTFRSSAIS